MHTGCLVALQVNVSFVDVSIRIYEPCFIGKPAPSAGLVVASMVVVMAADIVVGHVSRPRWF